MNFLSRLRAMTCSHKRTKEAKLLYKKISQQRLRIKKLIENLKVQELWRKEYTGALGNLTEAMQSCVWKKDQEHKYILANSLHCEYFFGFDATQECLEAILGKTDPELIQEYYSEKNIQNTFGDLCMASDIHAADTIHPTHYLEAGVIGGQEVLLYCVKIPRFNNDEFQGTIGIGWDFSDQSKFVINLLNRWIYEERAVELYRSDKTFCYNIKPKEHQCQVFHHLCPYPQHRKDLLNSELFKGA